MMLWYEERDCFGLGGWRGGGKRERKDKERNRTVGGKSKKKMLTDHQEVTSVRATL